MTIIACHTIPSRWGWKLVSTVAYSVLLWMIYIAKHSWSVLQLLPVHIHTFPWLCKLPQLLNQCVSAVFHKRNHLKQTNKQTNKQQLSTWNFQLEKSKVSDSLLSFWQQRRSGTAVVFASSMPPPWLGTVLVVNFSYDPRCLEIAAI